MAFHHDWLFRRLAQHTIHPVAGSTHTRLDMDPAHVFNEAGVASALLRSTREPGPITIHARRWAGEIAGTTITTIPREELPLPLRLSHLRP